MKKSVAPKLNALQIENILDKVVPLVAAKEDFAFFRFAIGETLATCNSASAAMFIKNFLEEAAA